MRLDPAPAPAYDGNMKNTVRQETAMTRDIPPFEWKYLFLPEDADSAPASRLAGACKTALWLGVSILVGLGLDRLC